jgi:hypothetical protein
VPRDGHRQRRSPRHVGWRRAAPMSFYYPGVAKPAATAACSSQQTWRRRLRLSRARSR